MIEKIIDTEGIIERVSDVKSALQPLIDAEEKLKTIGFLQTPALINEGKIYDYVVGYMF